MSNNLADIIINQLIGAMIGTGVSFVMAWYFYKKGDFPNKIIRAMTENLLAIVVQSRLGKIFEFHQNVPREELPRDLCIPHITQFWCTAETLRQGESTWVLFRAEDTGLNFGGGKMSEVTETSSHRCFPVTDEAFGYFSCKINFPDDATIGLHVVTFKLTDKKGHSHMQSLRFLVTQRATEQD